MNKHINEPETGNRPGVYELENREGEKVRMVAQNFPQADALVRMQATFVQSLEDWKKAEVEKLKAKAEGSDKKGK